MINVVAVLLTVIAGLTLCAVILLCIAMFMMASSMDKESWEKNDMGKGCDDVEED